MERISFCYILLEYWTGLNYKNYKNSFCKTFPYTYPVRRRFLVDCKCCHLKIMLYSHIFSVLLTWVVKEKIEMLQKHVAYVNCPVGFLYLTVLSCFALFFSLYTDILVHGNCIYTIDAVVKKHGAKMLEYPFKATHTLVYVCLCLSLRSDSLVTFALQTTPERSINGCCHVIKCER